MGLSVFDERQPYIDYEQIDNAWGTAIVQLLGQNPAFFRVDSLILTSTDVVDHLVQLWGCLSGGTQTLLGTVNVPALAGTDPAIPAVDAIPLIFPIQLGFVCGNQFGLGVGPTVAVTATKYIYVTVLAGYV